MKKALFQTALDVCALCSISFFVYIFYNLNSTIIERLILRYVDVNSKEFSLYIQYVIPVWIFSSAIFFLCTTVSASLFMRSDFFNRFIITIIVIIGWSFILISTIDAFAEIYETISNSVPCLVGKDKSSYRYFSVVTFTTLGYGDIHPINICRSIASTQALVGMIAIPVFIGMIVSLIEFFLRTARIN